MSNRINPIKPRPWSAKGRSYLDKAGCAGLAGDLLCSRQLPSRWSLGRVSTPATRVEQIITLALQEGACLTPADLGRPDLATKAVNQLGAENAKLKNQLAKLKDSK